MPAALSQNAPVRSSAPADTVPSLTPFQRKVVADLRRQLGANIRYQDGYYIGGEPPANIGVCTDVVVRAFRAGGMDLRQAVARDIRAHTGKYPLSRPNANIDHRRCRNLVVFFRRHARTLPTSGAKADWQPGDIVFWDTHDNGTIDHVGITSDTRDRNGEWAVVHLWPGQTVMEIEGLHAWKARYHFRWQP